MNLEHEEKDKALKTDNGELKARLERPLLGEMQAGRFTAANLTTPFTTVPPAGKRIRDLESSPPQPRLHSKEPQASWAAYRGAFSGKLPYFPATALPER